ncbi:FAD-binding oxidoreductase [Luteolibacter sp. GHJ8]|uniref:FAD-binding oxidoreductase n=1 Tax=Luteolibacter rhizosphaerae TaxID=2989719 RepID=A0ABT3G505_9BACT|nr:FAD-binding oxidoreductase [Luteolibacter rhizosphaerae]MCW1914921.1 FAD-binding oxidoreductase [Luteolibacter rhizosphaerae]
MSSISRRSFIGLSVAALPAWGQGKSANSYLKPGDAGYEAARRPFNSTVLLKPALIACCRTEADVCAAVKHAKDAGLPVAVKSGGHAFHGSSLNEGGLLVELSGMANRLLEKDTKRFTAGPGLKLKDCYSWLLERGRLLPAGSCGGVGLAGLTLGGGYGLFSREFGLTCDHLTQVRLVDGNGEIRDSRDEPELLWACRGGGNGNFGIATSFTFETQIAPKTLASRKFTAKGLDTPGLARRLERWFEIATSLPEPCFSAVILNGSQATVLLSSTKSAEGPAFVNATKALLQSGFGSKGPVTKPLGIAIGRYEGRPGPLPFDNVSAGFYRGFEDLRSAAGGICATVRETPGLIFQVNTLGGAITRGPDSAYAHRELPFLGELQAYWEKGTIPTKLAAGHASVRQALHDAGIRRHYGNYPDPRITDWATAYYGATYAKLQEIKEKLDPEDRIRHPQSVRLPNA